jgi:hypothetical protein
MCADAAEAKGTRRSLRCLLGFLGAEPLSGFLFCPLFFSAKEKWTRIRDKRKNKIAGAEKPHFFLRWIKNSLLPSAPEIGESHEATNVNPIASASLITLERTSRRVDSSRTMPPLPT